MERKVPIPTSLILSVVDYKDANHWYWRLTDAAGHVLADQEVNLNPTDSEYEGFLDLPVSRTSRNDSSEG